jgi:hypothetical protein
MSLNCAGSFGSLKFLDKRSDNESFQIDLGFLTIGQLAFVGDSQCLLTAQTSMMLIQCFFGNLFWISQSHPKLLNP